MSLSQNTVDMFVRGQACGVRLVQGAWWTAGPEVFGSVLTAGAAAGPSCVLWTTDPTAVTAGRLRVQQKHRSVTLTLMAEAQLGSRVSTKAETLQLDLLEPSLQMRS